MEFKNEETGKIMYIDYLSRWMNMVGCYKITMFSPENKYIRIVKCKSKWYNKDKVIYQPNSDNFNLDETINAILQLLDKTPYSMWFTLESYEKWYNDNFTNEIKMY